MGDRSAQRARIIDAMADVVAERGVAGASVECVCTRARVSRRTFNACFADVDQCVVAVMREALVQLGGLASRALEREQNWLDGVRAALAEVLVFLDREPALARVCVVESLGGGAVVREQRECLVSAFRALIVERIEREAPGVSPVMADAVMASVLGAIHVHIVTGQPGPLIDLHGGSMGLIAALYAGAGELERELGRAAALTQEMLVWDGSANGNAPAVANANVESNGSVDEELVPDVLLRPGAFRLRQCLRYVAERSGRGLVGGRGLSNQEVGEGIGVSHSGQVSRLLGQLAGMGLLVKRSAGPGRPNAWQATAHGEFVVRALERNRGR